MHIYKFELFTCVPSVSHSNIYLNPKACEWYGTGNRNTRAVPHLTAQAVKSWSSGLWRGAVRW